MALFVRSPFEALFNLQRALDASRTSDWLGRSPSGAGSYPPINVFRQGDSFLVIAELAGTRRDEVDIQVHENRVRITGTKAIDYGEGASLHRRERVAGKFDRTISIPVEVDTDHVKAEYRNGVLALLLPQAERHKSKSVAIN